jgi:predicted nucleic acid-binding Zn ribbon protein
MRIRVEMGCVPAYSGVRLLAMPTYVYETTNPKKTVRRFEIEQSMKDQPLKVDPKTGEPVRRVISGGHGVLVKGGSTGPCVGSCGHH